jgi:trans-aconitate methyltransferase
MVLQAAEELDQWYGQPDPWGYYSSSDDQRRRDTLLSELPLRPYQRVLDIGCGQGFLTQSLPGHEIIGVDISASAIAFARRKEYPKCHFQQASLFELPELFQKQFDLITITGVLYPQYIGRATNLVYRIIDPLLARGGVLASVHIDAWYQCRFPYLLMKEHFYPYRTYIHRLEIYVK